MSLRVLPSGRALAAQGRFLSTEPSGRRQHSCCSAAPSQAVPGPRGIETLCQPDFLASTWF